MTHWTGEAERRDSESLNEPSLTGQLTGPLLVGRDAERAVLHTLVTGDRGGSLLIRGAAGIGKSTVVEDAGRYARDRGMRVLTAVGVRSESRLPFAGLHLLLRPILADTDALPPHQRDAILAALDLVDAPAPGLFRIALAALDLLAASAAGRPILLIVEDIQWLDRSSCEVLSFVARRLDSDPAVLVATCRDGEGSDNPLVTAGLPELHLDPLDPLNAAALLDVHAADLPADLRQRLLAEAAGNPLALVELPVAARHLGDAASLPAWLPLTTRLEQAFADRVADLPPVTRTALLVVALDDGDALSEILAATARVTDPRMADGPGVAVEQPAVAVKGPRAAVEDSRVTIEDSRVTVEDLAPATAAGLIHVDEMSVHFRHPLVRSAIYQMASIAQRHLVHGALARVLAAEPDRQVWHHAASRIGPDEQVAAELEQAAERAARRGAVGVAAGALERAARFSGDPVRRGQRLLQAAEAAFELGRHEKVARLLRDAEPLDLAPAERTRLSWLREVLVDGSWSGADRIAAFVEIAEQMRREGDPDRALSALLAMALRAWWSNPDKQTRDLVVTAAERLPVASDDPRLISVLALAAPVERGAAIIARLTGRNRIDTGNSTVDSLLATAASAVGAFDQAGPLHASAVAGMRAQGRLALLAQTLVGQAWTGVNLGDPSTARPAAEEAYRLANETGQPRWAAVAQLAEAVLAGRRGETGTAEVLAAQAEQVLLPIGANPMLALVQLARGTTALGSGRHAEAYEQLRRIFDPADSAYHPHVRSWALLDLVESAVHSGHREPVRRLQPELVRLAETTNSPILRATLSCAAPMLAEDTSTGPDGDVEALFQAALRADLTSWPFHRGRLLLAHGGWLRRRRRAAESRASLRAAREIFDAFGATPWGDRARQELRASGESSRRRPPGPLDALTPQELQIAQMAAAGLTNREIGQRLYLSHRTVGTHLYRIFPKLGITSRSELGGAVARLTAAYVT